MEWLKSVWARWKVQVSFVGGALVVATAYGTCTVEPPAAETAPAEVSEEEPAAEVTESSNTTPAATTTEAANTNVASEDQNTESSTTATENADAENTATTSD